MDETKQCPISRFQHCRGDKCAWYYGSGCAVLLLAWIDHSLQSGLVKSQEGDSNVLD